MAFLVDVKTVLNCVVFQVGYEAGDIYGGQAGPFRNPRPDYRLSATPSLSMADTVISQAFRAGRVNR